MRLATIVRLLALALSIASSGGAAALTTKEYEARFAAFAASGKWEGYGHPIILLTPGGYDEGLDAGARARLHAAVERRDCDVVIALEVEGFLALHPDRGQPSERSRKHIEDRVLQRSKPLRRCLMLRILDNVWSEAVRRGETLAPTKTVQPPRFVYDARGGRREMVPSPAETGQCWALVALLELALRYDYTPALADVAALATEGRRLKLTPEEELFVAERALHAGLIDESVVWRVRRRITTLNDWEQARVRAAAKRGEILLGAFSMAACVPREV